MLSTTHKSLLRKDRHEDNIVDNTVLLSTIPTDVVHDVVLV